MNNTVPFARTSPPPSNPLLDTNNTEYDQNLRLVPQANIPGAGMGVQIIHAVKKGTILGLYLNHSNINRVTVSRIRDPSNHSVYAVNFEGLVRDAYDPASGSVSFFF